MSRDSKNRAKDSAASKSQRRSEDDQSSTADPRDAQEQEKATADEAESDHKHLERPTDVVDEATPARRPDSTRPERCAAPVTSHPPFFRLRRRGTSEPCAQTASVTAPSWAPVRRP